MIKQHILRTAGILAVCMVGIFGPDLPSFQSSRGLLAVDEDGHRQLQGTCELSTPGSVVESREDFENGDYTGWSLEGDWTAGGVDSTHPDTFTSFLGRFGKGQSTSKRYPITAGAKGAQVAFTFYEIDSWDGGADKMVAYINGVELDMGPFKLTVDEGTRKGEVNGISWLATTNAPPAELGFNTAWVGDQMHYITIEVPEDQVSSGSLVFGVKIITNEPIDNESGGIDNINVISCPPPTRKPSPPPTSPPTPPLTPSPTPEKFDAGVNGDPLIMGLSGQLFNFEGRSGAWYSAVSTSSLQWNLRVQNYETCPAHSNNFVSGAGFTFFKNGRATNSIEVNVVSPSHVDIGCGESEGYCLGAGSLELIINGIKHTVGGDYKTKDRAVSILAFNTFYQCSRKWFDFDVHPSEKNAVSLRNGRRLDNEDPNVFDVIEGIKGTMIDHEVCEQWIQDRKVLGDMFRQAGHYSTVIIQSEDITLHLEYKQENERCNAHSVDVWISSVSPSLLDEKWEGIIGETKNPSYVPNGEHTMIDRLEALKHASDENYEVNSSFSNRCKGCADRHD